MSSILSAYKNRGNLFRMLTLHHRRLQLSHHKWFWWWSIKVCIESREKKPKEKIKSRTINAETTNETKTFYNDREKNLGFVIQIFLASSFKFQSLFSSHGKAWHERRVSTGFKQLSDRACILITILCHYQCHYTTHNFTSSLSSPRLYLQLMRKVEYQVWSEDDGKELAFTVGWRLPLTLPEARDED